MTARKKKFKHIYGPVPSWRLGSSLGIDILSQKEKICNFNCAYCQLGRTKKHINQRKIYIPSKDILKEIKSIPAAHIDYITFSGKGEPTLAKNLGAIIKKIKAVRKEKTAIITNAVLLNNIDVRRALSSADLVSVKLDSYSEQSLKEINRPAGDITFKNILDGILKFRKEYKGVLALQIMFTKENMPYADKFAKIAGQIRPDIVHINTPLRKSPVIPLSKKEIAKIKKYFMGIIIDSVYDKKRKEIIPISHKDTVKRRGTVIS